jgi:tetratricopeptide (TPR) repeat protein
VSTSHNQTVGQSPTRLRPWLIAVATASVVLASVLAFRFDWLTMPQREKTQVPAAYVGSAACASCHQPQFDAWERSHHAHAMAEANPETVLGRFDGERHTYAGITSRFLRDGDAFVVETDGPDGRLEPFPVRYTFGVTPLQQYLIDLPGGRLQALSLSWDARPADAGGQRWFHLYPDQNIRHDDPLHWTGLQQNWNYMCADCHSTALRKNYDPTTQEYRTEWSEINVGCEACHGPASNHLAWADRRGEWQTFEAGAKGFRISYDERRGVSWPADPESGVPRRSRPRETDKEISACAQCHARRAQISEDYEPGRPIGDGYLIALLDDGLYWRDGQMRDEVFNHGSFLQSRMHGSGVTCSDCHEPHSGSLLAPGNAVCAQCHLSAKYDQPEHHRHDAASAGARCVGCHMPPTTYMVVDPRHDHSMRVPRPDLSVSLGVPNACNVCHVGQEPEWAAQAVFEWLGRAPGGFQTFAADFDAWDRYLPDARTRLLRLLEDPAQPAIVRASALSRMARDPQPPIVDAAARALDDVDELVRRAAIDVLALTEPVVRARHLPRMTRDPVRAVRITAARALATIDVSVEFREAVASALEEYVASQTYNLDRPEAHMNLGALYQELGQLDRAEAAYRAALDRYPAGVQARINLADLSRLRQDEAQAQQILREALKADPRAAATHYALGLSYVRSQQPRRALEHLGTAAKLAADEPRYTYVYAVALHSYGDSRRGIDMLEQAHRNFPGEREILQALAGMLADGGEVERARRYAALLVELTPEDPQAQQLQRSLATP